MSMHRTVPLEVQFYGQCMQLNVWLLIEIQFENTLGLIHEKSNSLKSHGVGVLRIYIGHRGLILSTKRPEIRLRNVLSTKRPTPCQYMRDDPSVVA